MEDFISLLARLRPWLLFILTTAPMVAGMSLFYPPIVPMDDLATLQSSFTNMMYVSMPGWLVLYSWIMTVGIVCNRSLDASLRKSERLFRYSMPIAMIYFIVASWAFPEAMLNDSRTTLRMIVVPAHIVASFLLFYSVIFSARSLAMLDHPDGPGFWRSLRYFLGLLYFPIGLWFIQPRINAISASSGDGR